MRDPGEEDGALVQAARQGDRQAFALLYHRYKPDVWNLAYLTLRNEHEAEDCLQETFVKALRALSTDTSIEAVRPWLLTIARNACLDRLRAAKRRTFVSIDDEAIPELPAPARQVDGWLDFRLALERLPREDREAFMLVDVLGYRSHEAATILGVAAPSTLRSRVASARRQLAPSLLEATDEWPAEIWGVYHQPPNSAIVASLGPDSGKRGSRANIAEQASIAELIANCARAPVRDPAGVRLRRGGRFAVELVDFFVRLDDRIPEELRVLAVIDGRQQRLEGTAQHWLADHPRWQVRRAVSHAGWLLDVESLLRAAGPESHQAESHRAAIAALDAPTPFLWTHGR
jgi:RNA polymerase sigma-70 factor (ECF subfamily)